MILFGNLREFETSTSIIGETLSMKNCVRISNVLITLLKPGLGAGVGWMLEDGEVWMLECGVGWVVVGGGEVVIVTVKICPESWVYPAARRRANLPSTTCVYSSLALFQQQSFAKKKQRNKTYYQNDLIWHPRVGASIRGTANCTVPRWNF